MNCNKPLYSAGIIIELTPDQGGPRKWGSHQWCFAKKRSGGAPFSNLAFS